MATFNWYYGSIRGVDAEKFHNLLEAVQKGDKEETKSNLLALVGSSTDGYNISDVSIRARVYCYLITAAADITPEEIHAKKMQKRESKKQIQGSRRREVVESDADDTLKLKLDALKKSIVDKNKVLLQYLYKDILEEDEDVMTVIFCNLHHFKKYQVPYFKGCTPEVVEEIISKRWEIAQEILEYYFDRRFFDDIIEKLKEASSMGDTGFIKAYQILCGHLSDRGLKAGARLLWLLTKKRHDDAHHPKQIGDLIEELVKKVFNDWNFQRHFLTSPSRSYEEYDLELSDREVTDIVNDGRGEPICVGQVCGVGPVHTDDILLCWAARRNYHDLIWCVMKAYKAKSDDGYNDWGEPFETDFVWKITLWCATRHGDFWRVIKELSEPEWTKSIDFNDYPAGWLPPLHLAAILGDMDRMETLCKYLNVKKCANKKDYMGRTPLDYAMKFKVTTGMSKASNVCHKGVVKKLLSMKGVDKRLKEIYDIYIHQANTVLIGAALIASVTFAAWMQPPLGYDDYFQFTRPRPQSSDGRTYYESYLAIQGHPIIHAFVVFNTLSFFLAIATVLVGAEATLFVHDSEEKTMALRRMRKSIKWMIGFFIGSMLCIMAAFICAGITILPPIRSLEWSMIISLVTGGAISIVPLYWIYWSLNKKERAPSRFGSQCIGSQPQLQPQQSLKKIEKLEGLIDKEEFKRRQQEEEDLCF